LPMLNTAGMAPPILLGGTYAFFIYFIAAVAAVPIGKQGTTLVAGPAHFTGAQHLESRIEADLGSSDFNVVAWIKTASGGTIFSKHVQDGERWMPHAKSLFIYRAGTVAFDVGHVGQVESKRVVTNDQWHHVALTYQKSNKQATLYIDGVQDGQIVMDVIPDPDGHVIKVGHTGLDFGGNFRGYMRDVKVSPTFISQQDVLQIYKSQVETEAMLHSYAAVNLQAHSHMHLLVVSSMSRRFEDLRPPDLHPDTPRTPAALTALAGPSFGTVNTGNETTAKVAPSPPSRKGDNAAAAGDSAERNIKLKEGARERAGKKDSQDETRRDADTAKSAAEAEAARQAAEADAAKQAKIAADEAREEAAAKVAAEEQAANAAAEEHKREEEALAAKQSAEAEAAEAAAEDLKAAEEEAKKAAEAAKAEEEAKKATEAAKAEEGVKNVAEAAKAEEEAKNVAEAAKAEEEAKKAAEAAKAEEEAKNVAEAAKAEEEAKKAAEAAKAEEEANNVAEAAKAEEEAKKAAEAAKAEESESTAAEEEEEDEIAQIEAAAKQAVESSSMMEKEGEAARKAAEADALKQDAEADLADAEAEA